ncbi:hypothetical protein SDC9_163884 [bioreactor metagenome]|uniref:Uncharacterized protein n=1 Tax=bioreactor metagenome TaxID=1076179 RepID=A0A645FRL9_9ZZZZ
MEDCDGVLRLAGDAKLGNEIGHRLIEGELPFCRQNTQGQRHRGFAHGSNAVNRLRVHRAVMGQIAETVALFKDNAFRPADSHGNAGQLCLFDVPRKRGIQCAQVIIHVDLISSVYKLAYLGYQKIQSILSRQKVMGQKAVSILPTSHPQ